MCVYEEEDRESNGIKHFYYIRQDVEGCARERALSNLPRVKGDEGALR